MAPFPADVQEVVLSILSKIAVVFVALFAVVLVAMTTTFVARTENWKEKYEKEAANRQAADSTASLRQTQINALQDKESQRVAELKGEVARLNEQLTARLTELAAARTEAQAAKNQIVKTEGDLSRLTAASTLATEMNSMMKVELDQRREALIGAQTKLIQLNDRNTELESQVETLSRQGKRLAEQLQMQEERFTQDIARIRTGQTSGNATDALTSTVEIVPSHAIRGQITDSKKIDDNLFVEINVGKRDGVENNTKFIIHRGNNFLGTLVVTKVDAKTAAGRVTLSQGAINKGDDVLAGAF